MPKVKIKFLTLFCKRNPQIVFHHKLNSTRKISSRASIITYTNTSLDGAPTGRAVLHSLLLMELIARGADHLMSTREKNHGHLLRKAHHTLPFALHARIFLEFWNYFGDNGSWGIPNVFQCASITSVNASS